MKLNYLNGMQTGASALTAYRKWMDTVSENLANAQTTRTPEGGAYQRKQVTFESVAGKGVAARKLAATAEPTRTHPQHMGGQEQAVQQSGAAPAVRANVEPDTTATGAKVFDPSHPDADADGWVEYPNVNPVTDMVNLILASRAYEANVAALATEKRVQEMALAIGQA
jgi:flagellar basal-body rod protein FlgC